MAASLPQDASKIPQEAHRRPPGTLWDPQKMKKSIGKISISRLYACRASRTSRSRPRAPKSPQKLPKTPPRRPKTTPREATKKPQEAPKMRQDASKRPQEAPRGHKRPQEIPKTCPRGLQDMPKRPLRGPRRPQEAPRTPQDAPKPPHVDSTLESILNPPEVLINWRGGTKAQPSTICRASPKDCAWRTESLP